MVDSSWVLTVADHVLWDLSVLKCLKQHTSEIISRSLILTPPANYKFCDNKGFDLGVGYEWMG